MSTTPRTDDFWKRYYARFPDGSGSTAAERIWWDTELKSYESDLSTAQDRIKTLEEERVAIKHAMGFEDQMSYEPDLVVAAEAQIASCNALRSERDKLQQERDGWKASFGHENARHQQACRACDKYLSDLASLQAELEQVKRERDHGIERMEAAQKAFIRIREMVGATERDPMPCESYVQRVVTQLTSLQKELEEVKRERDKWQRRYEEKEKPTRALGENLAAATAENARLREELEWLYAKCKIVHWEHVNAYPIEHNPMANKDSRPFLDAARTKYALSPQSPEPAAAQVEETISNDSSGVESRHANSSGSGPERKDDDQVTTPVTDRENREIHMANSLDKTHSESSASPAVTTSTDTAGLGATPETKGESETPEDILPDEEHVYTLLGKLETANCTCFSDPEGSCEYCETFRKIENELQAIFAARDRAEAELKVAREALSTARDWIVANTTTPVHDLLTYLDTARKEAR